MTSSPVRKGPLTPDNLTHTDPALSIMVTVGEDGHPRSATAAEFADMWLGPAPTHFPPLVLMFLDRARACIAYGGFYYPLVTVGFGQLGLAAEAAIRIYAERHGLSITKKNGASKEFGSLIDELRAAKALSDHQKTYWGAMRELRNMLFHPEETVVPMGAVLINLNALTDAMLELFPLPSGEIWPPVDLLRKSQAKILGWSKNA